MGDMRKDYVLERNVIVHPTTKKNTDTKKCPYCPGNESMTNPSLLSLVERDGMLQRLQDSEDFFVENWSVRVFESKEPTVSISTKNSYSDRPLYSEPAYGYHYIVVVSPKHKDTLATISTEQLSNVLVVVQDRLRWLYTQKGVTYVTIFVNHGKESGSNVEHSHINMVSFSTLPPRIDEEAEASHQIVNEKGVCPMCQVINTETSGPRQILQTEGFIAFCPWAPSYPFEFWICPKKHSTSFSKITQKEINDVLESIYEKDYIKVGTNDNVGGNLKKHLKALNKRMKEAATNLEFEEAAKIRDEIRKLEATELEIVLNPKVKQYSLNNKVYPKGRSTMGMPGTRAKKGKKKWKQIK